jgi:hypothetical protein
MPTCASARRSKRAVCHRSGALAFITYRGISSVDLQCVDSVQYPCTDFHYCTYLLGVPATVYFQPHDGGVQIFPR